MSATKGRALRFKVGTSADGPFSVVAGIESVTLDRDGMTVDVTTLSDADIVKLIVMRDCKITASGNYEPGDTNGQAVIESAYENGTDLWGQVLYNGTNGKKVQILVSKFSINGASKDKVGVSLEFEGTGAVSTV